MGWSAEDCTGERTATEENAAHQHNLRLIYCEILAQSSETARSQAFAQWVATLPTEDLEYIDNLVAQDLCQMMGRIRDQ